MSYPHFSPDCSDYHHLVRDFNGERPKIVCLCGSTRFYAEFMRAAQCETLAGNIVLSVGYFVHRTYTPPWKSAEEPVTPEQKLKLDELHKRKIDLCDEVFVLNVGGYIGDSTRSEIEYAIDHNKPVRYLEPLGG